ncbi:11508_t:CDS:2 [Funneliformis geosporum]|nr:11508_t:CDS:2 [Funneliformis geosporum]
MSKTRTNSNNNHSQLNSNYRKKRLKEICYCNRCNGTLVDLRTKPSEDQIYPFLEMLDNSLDILSNTQDQYIEQMVNENSHEGENQQIFEDANIDPIPRKCVRYANRNIELSAESSNY